MKKPLLISLTALAVLGITTATTLYAQTTTGSSVIARMKAAAAAFTLTADLNPGQTGYDSAPLSWKKTGNMLTAAEWNRMLEIISQGSVASSSTGSSNPLFYYCTNDQSLDATNVPCYGASRNQGLWDGRYRVVSCHIKGSTGHESINSQLLNFGRTGLAGMQDKWNSLYTDSQWQLCIEGSVLVVDTQGVASGAGSTGGDKFTFLDSQIELFTSGQKKTDKTTPVALDISTIPGVTIPANVKAVQLYVYCANFTNQNEGVSLNLGRASTAMLRVCQQNVTGAANDVDTNIVFIPLADDKKTIYYSYNVPSTENGWQVSFFLRGFITE